MEKKIDKLQTIVYILLGLTALNTLLMIVGDYKTENKSTVDLAKVNDQAETPEYDTSMYKDVSVTEALDIVKDGTRVLYVGRATCPHCVSYAPTLNESLKTHNYEVLYIDLEKLGNGDYEKIIAFDPYFEQNFGTTPMTVIFKDGKIVDNREGRISLEELTTMLEKHGISKK